MWEASGTGLVVPMDNHIAWAADMSSDDMRRTVDALYRVHRLISVITDLDMLLERIMDEGKQLARAEACSLMLYDPGRSDLYFQVALGEQGDQQALKREIRLKLGEGIAGLAASSREIINVEDAAADARVFRRADETSHFQTRSILAVPLVDRDNLIGVLEMVNKRDGEVFNDTDMHVMEMFSSLAATAIANARLIEENLRAERLAALGQAVAGLSHCTKNILTGLRGSAELVDQGLQLGNMELVNRSWPVLLRSTKRISNVVEDMLAFSKPRVPTFEPCDLAELINEVRETLSSLLADKTVALEMDVDDACRNVQLDAYGFFRCLLNLMQNAADAAPREGGKVRVTARLSDTGDLCVNVADNGPGVPDAMAAEIFDPFFSSKGSQGTGLGLAVTKKIVEEHGGDITVSRSAESGALFRVVVPNARAAEPTRTES